MEGSLEQCNVRVQGRREWLFLFEALLPLPAFCTRMTQKKRIVWARSVCQCAEGASAGVVLRKTRLGALVLAVVPGSDSAASDVSPGCLLVDVNG